MILILLFSILSLFLGLVLLFNAFNKKIISSVLYSIFLIVILACFVEIKGTPKDIKYEWRSLKDNTIIATYEDEPNAIFIWLNRNDSKEPVSYKLPWSIETAENLRKSKERSKNTNGEIELNMDMNDMDSDLPNPFREKRSPSLPPKASMK